MTNRRLLHHAEMSGGVGIGRVEQVLQRSTFGRGAARLEVAVVAGQSAIVGASAVNPVKLLTPRARGRSVWAYTSSFGGGLLAGDNTRLEIDIHPGGRCFLGTQSATRVYRNPSRLPCSHQTRARLGAESLLVFAPDRVQPFAESSYRQDQQWQLEADAGLVLLDWFSSGRVARQEQWNFECFETRNEVYLDGELIWIDSLRLRPSQAAWNPSYVTGRYNCFATLLMTGPPVQKLAEEFLSDYAARPVERRPNLLVSASSCRGGAMVRLAGVSTEEVERELKPQLERVAPLLGDNPWARKW